MVSALPLIATEERTWQYFSQVPIAAIAIAPKLLCARPAEAVVRPYRRSNAKAEKSKKRSIFIDRCSLQLVDTVKKALAAKIQYLEFPGVRGNGIASRTLESPVT
jgi:hypothetical protein